MMAAVTATFTIVCADQVEYDLTLAVLSTHPQLVSLTQDEPNFTLTLALDYSLPG